MWPFIDVVDGNQRALMNEAMRSGAADSRSGTCNDGNFPVYVHFVSHPLSGVVIAVRQPATVSAFRIALPHAVPRAGIAQRVANGVSAGSLITAFGSS
jgi:hypothetical protein